MTIYIAADHAGFKLKAAVIGYLQAQNKPYIDLGTDNEESVDYPRFASLLCQEVLTDNSHIGILICGTGIGMSIMANRFKGIRAAVCNEGTKSASLARLHNNANVLCLGARLISEQQALSIVETFLHTPFEGGRHHVRLELLDKDAGC